MAHWYQSRWMRSRKSPRAPAPGCLPALLGACLQVLTGTLTGMLLLHLVGSHLWGACQTLESTFKVFRLRLIGMHVLGHSMCSDHWHGRIVPKRSPFLLPDVRWQRRNLSHVQLQYHQVGKWGGRVAEWRCRDNWHELEVQTPVCLPLWEVFLYYFFDHFFFNFLYFFL